MMSEHDGTDALAEKWGVFLALGFGFDMRAWDARLASLPPESGARLTALRHRDGLLRSLESRQCEMMVRDKIELMVRTTTMAMHRRNVEAGAALNKARSAPRLTRVNEWIATQLRRDPSAKSPELWARAPEEVTDVIEFGRFQKRVTAVRKQQKKDAVH